MITWDGILWKNNSTNYNADKILVPLIFMVLLFIPVLFADIAPERINAFINDMPEVVRNLHLVMLIIAMLIWCVTFYYVPINVYIAVVAVYTVVSWTWILMRKKGTAMYFIVWFVLGVLSILLYWRLGPIYYSMINM